MRALEVVGRVEGGEGGVELSRPWYVVVERDQIERCTSPVPGEMGVMAVPDAQASGVFSCMKRGDVKGRAGAADTQRTWWFENKSEARFDRRGHSRQTRPSKPSSGPT